MDRSNEDNSDDLLVRLCTAALTAQPPAAPAGPPQVSESRQGYEQVKGNLLKMAEKMPAESYDFKPVPEIRSFGELMAHVADSQMRTCSTVNGQQKSAEAASKKTKDELVAALKAAFAECDAAWDATNEGNAFQMISAGAGSVPVSGRYPQHGNS